MFMCVQCHSCVGWWPWRPETDVWSCSTVATNSCELPNMGSGNQMHASSPLIHLSFMFIIIFILYFIFIFIPLNIILLLLFLEAVECSTCLASISPLSCMFSPGVFAFHLSFNPVHFSWPPFFLSRSVDSPSALLWWSSENRDSQLMRKVTAWPGGRGHLGCFISRENHTVTNKLPEFLKA